MLALGVALAPVCARELTIEDRVKALERMERAAYGHQIGATRRFEEAVPREVLTRRVALYLEQSAALETLWRTTVTAEMLKREMERQARRTRMPGRLLEIYGALGNDSDLVAECLARPILVDRLSRDFFAFDARVHGDEKREAESLRAALEERGDEGMTSDPRRSEVVISVQGTHELEMVPWNDDRRHVPVGQIEFVRLRKRLPQRVGEIGGVTEDRDSFEVRVLLEERPDFLRVATYSVKKRSWDEWWAETSKNLDTNLVDAIPDSDRADWKATFERCRTLLENQMGKSPVGCAPDDTWDNGSLDDVPDAREGHTAVWTGSVMIIWGGASYFEVQTGSRYDPATDTWTPTSIVGAPSGRLAHTAVWTGDRMVIWGGKVLSTYLNTGGVYDPVSDSWVPTSLVNVPLARDYHTAVWTGEEMIVWGGFGFTGALNNGARYSPASDQWSSTTVVGSPTARSGHTAVWTGNRMIVWGGGDTALENTGGQYDPETDSWTPTSTSGSPVGRVFHDVVWTGSRMVVWGGFDGTSSLNTGGLYNPASNTWSPTSTVGAPPAIVGSTAVWTGTRMIVWGGFLSNAGGRYNPVTNTWTSVSIVNAPTARENHSAVWTGSLMIVWGGSPTDVGYLNTGGRYDPESDQWTPTATEVSPPREEHVAVWTGSRMIVWGGTDGPDILNTGNRYDPVTDSWTPTSTAGAPTPRYAHSVVWTGSLMIVWGGAVVSNGDLGDRYDPIADIWTDVSSVGQPRKRASPSAVWTGSEMIVWGGQDGSTILNDGGRYNPTTNAWRPTSTAGAPTKRMGHAAVWTGNRMIVWGGFKSGNLNSGGRYDPVADTWTSTSLTGAPEARSLHSAIWTGTRMVVWGGQGPSEPASGSQYDPTSDSWTSTSLTGAPEGRFWHGAIWTGSLMVVWGGEGGATGYLNTGGRYDPATDTWTPTSLVDAPSPRRHHTAVWTGEAMIVWGGQNAMSTGGRYLIAQPIDLDGDGYTVCGGDCNDSNPGIHPGAVEVCNGLDDDCNLVMDDGIAVPSTRPAVAVTKSGTNAELSWAPASDATAYDAVKGNLGPLRDSLGDFTVATSACMANDLGLTSLEDSEVPPLNGGLWYLVRSVNACSGAGTYDAPGASQLGSRDAEIASSLNACP